MCGGVEEIIKNYFYHALSKYFDSSRVTAMKLIFICFKQLLDVKLKFSNEIKIKTLSIVSNIFILFIYFPKI
jgi:hypothetical protein